MRSQMLKFILCRRMLAVNQTDKMLDLFPLSLIYICIKISCATLYTEWKNGVILT